MSDEGGVTLLVVPEGGGETRTLRLGRRKLRLLAWAGGILFVLLSLLSGSWWYMAARAYHASQLEAEVGGFAEERVRIAELARTLQEVEAGYERVRALFGPGPDAVGGGVWLPSASGPAPAGSRIPDGEHEPSGWPLAERGFVTQVLLEGGSGQHPGVDIAVPSGSYIRAAGAAVVAETGEDPTYGLYVILDHGEGYRSLYAHASLLLVEEGDTVRRYEVIALSGSSGRSTAPHLHFEILLDGEPVDPLALVAQP